VNYAGLPDHPGRSVHYSQVRQGVYFSTALASSSLLDRNWTSITVLNHCAYYIPHLLIPGKGSGLRSQFPHRLTGALKARRRNHQVLQRNGQLR
jgi:hypothetical protein